MAKQGGGAIELSSNKKAKADDLFGDIQPEDVDKDDGQ
jgi:hypothetical protein